MSLGFMFLFVFFWGLILVFFYNFHFLLVLLGLEILLLSVLTQMVTLFGGVEMVGLFFYFLVLVCMGGFGISFLVCMSRGWGLDFWYKGLFF